MGSNKEIAEVVEGLLSTSSKGVETLARELGVSVATVTRWVKGESRPRPKVEGQLRLLACARGIDSEPTGQKELFELEPEEKGLRGLLAATLAELREVLHRTGRLSSRHEALDEIAKLLFAHVLSVDSGGYGIDESLVEGGINPAVALKSFVARVYERHLPKSLAHEVGLKDFDLRIKDTEERFAREVIECFGRVASPQAISDIRNPRFSDILNETFGQFLADSFVEEKELGQYLTPVEVVRFMVRLALNSLGEDEIEQLCSPDAPEKAGIVLDPSCGIGSFLAEVMRVLHLRLERVANSDDIEKWAHNFVESVIVGIDKSERMVKLALTNMAMFGASACNIHLANSLLRVGRDGEVMRGLEGRARLILTNPPFGAEFCGSDLKSYKLAGKWSARLSGRIDSELLFVERYLDWLAPGGVLVAIVPDSLLTNKGLFEDLRRGLAPDVQILSVISLPKVTFGAAGTDTKTSVLHLKKSTNGGKSRSKAYFAVCESVGYDVCSRGARRKKISSGSNGLIAILKEAVRTEKPAIGRIVEFDVAVDRWDATYHAGLPEEIQAKLEEQGNWGVRVGDVAYLGDEKSDPRRSGNSVFEYIEISDVDARSCEVRSKQVSSVEAPSRARRVVKAGDVLVSTVRPERKTVGVVPDYLEGAICSTGFAVLRCKGIEPLMLARLLQTDFANAQILRNNMGIAYPVIDEKCLMGVVLPVDTCQINRLGNVIRELSSTRKTVRELEEKIGQELSSMVKP